MEQFKISVIVPVYNMEKYLKKCVDTLMDQTYKNLEIILVNDGSADESGNLCEVYAKKDGRIKAVHKENGGLISAWKRGVEESTGEYLAFVDSDDWVDTNMFEELAEKLTGSDKEIISSDYVIEKEDGGKQYVWQQLAPGDYTGQQLNKKVVPMLLGNENRYVCMSRCMKLISRRLIVDNCKYSDPVIVTGEDMTIMLPALMDCERLVITDKKVYYHYYYVTTSMVHKYDRGLYQNIRLLREIILRIVKDKTRQEQYKEMVKRAEQEYVFLLLLALKNEARGNKAGYKENIMHICKDRETVDIVRKNTIQVNDMSNKLLYYVLRHPNGLSIRALRLAMILYYRRL